MPDRQGRKEDQEPHQWFCRRADKAFDQTVRKLAQSDRGHEAGAGGLPELRQWKLVNLPISPALNGARRNAQYLAKLSHRRCRFSSSSRHQHHRQPQIYTPAKEAYRHRRCALAAAVTAKTEAPFVVGANLVRTTSGFARKVGAMENAATRTSASPRLRSQVNIKLQQKQKKIGILQ